MRADVVNPVVRTAVHKQRYLEANRGFTFYQSETNTTVHLNKYRSIESGYPSQLPYLDVYYEQPKAQPQSYSTTYRIGQEVSISVKAYGTSDYAAIRQISMGINWNSASSLRRGVFGYYTYNPGDLWVGIGNGFYYYNDPAGHGSDKTSLLSGSYNAGTGTATFTFRINDNFGDLQDNDLDTRLSMTSAADPSGIWNSGITPNDTNIGIMPKACPAPSVTASGSSGWFREADRDGDGRPDSGCDDNDAGRGDFSLQWPVSPLADGYDVYLWDGGPYDAENSWHKVGETVGNGATTWRSAGFGGYPADSTIASWAANYDQNPYLCASSPSAATKLASTANDPNPLVPVDGEHALDGCGVMVCDGHYGYLLRWGTSAGPESWTKVDLAAIEAQSGHVPVLKTVGPPQGDMRSAFLLDGYIYGGRITAIDGDQATLAGIWKNAATDSTKTKTLTLSKRPLLRTDGSEVSTLTGNVLLACDGRRIYSAGRLVAGGYRIYEYDIDGEFIAGHDVSCPSGDIRGLIADGSGLILIGWSGTDQAPVARLSTESWTMTNRWQLDQAATKVINGCYDPIERTLWLGTYSETSNGYEGKLFRYSAPGLDLRDRAHSLYLKTDGSEGDSQQGYSFRIVPYSDQTGRLPILVNSRNNPLLLLDNRTLSVAEAPRHTTYSLGEFADHESQAVLDGGALESSIVDLSIATFGPTATLSRSYRSDRTSADLFAPGWRFGFQRRLRFDLTPGNNDDPTSIWKGQSGSGPDFTLTNVAYTASSGWDGSGTSADPFCLKGDGSDDYVSNSGSALNLGSGARSLFAWVKLTSLPAAGSSAQIFRKQLCDGTKRGWSLLIDSNGAIYSSIWQDLGAGQRISRYGGQGVSTGVWTHLGMVYDGSDLHVYVNGSLSDGAWGGAKGAWNTDNGENATVLGTAGAGTCVAGSLSQLQVYGRALSPSEISTIYALGKESTTGWPTNGLVSSLVAAEASDGHVMTYLDESGDEYRFLLENGSWQAPNGLVATLVDEGENWRLTTKDRRELLFRESDGALIAEIDANDNATTYDWDGGDLTIGAANGQTIDVDLDANGKIASASYQVSIGGQTKERRVAFSAAAPWTVTSSYWSAGQEETDLRRVTQYAYESGCLSQITLTSAADAHQAFAYTNGKLSRIEQPDFHSCPDAYATIAYETDGARTATVTRRGEVAGSATNVMQHFAWNPTGTIALRGNPTTEGTYESYAYAYSGDNQTIREISPGGNQAKHRGWRYDLRGNLIAEYDEQKERTTYAYAIDGDIFDELARSVDPKGCRTRYGYDGAGNLLWQERELTEGDDAQLARSEYDYDDLTVGGAQYKAALVEEKRKISEGAWAETDYEQYASNGEPQQTIARDVRLSDAVTDDLLSESSYDAFGNLTSQTEQHLSSEQNPPLVAANSYDLAGRLLASTDRTEVTTHHRYDAFGHEAESWRSHPQTSAKADWKTLANDGCGRIASETTKQRRMDLIVPLEMLDGTVVSTVSARDVAASLLYLDAADYDGATYYFEIVARNSDDAAHQVALRDVTNGRTLSTITVPATTYYHTRLRAQSAFLPSLGNSKLCLRLPALPPDEDVKVFAARIIVEQHNATKTRLQFPLLADAWATDGWRSDAPDEAHVAYMDGDYYDIEQWHSPFFVREDELLSTTAPGDAWSLETVQAHDAGGSSYACLFNASDDELVAASEIVRSASTYDVASVDFAADATHFEDGDSYRLASKSDGSGQCARIARAALYVELTDLSRAAVYWRVGNASWQGTGAEQIRTQRALLDLSAYSGQPSCYFETSALCADAAQRVFLCDTGVADAGSSGWSDVVGLSIDSGDRTRVRSTALNLQDDHRYAVRWAATTAAHQPMSHFLVVDVQASTAEQSTITHTYDGMGYEVGSNDSAIGGKEAKVEYDAQGNETATWEEGTAPAPGGGYVEAASTRAEYDELDQLLWEDEPGDTDDLFDDELWDYEYDEEGMLIEEDAPEGPISDPAVGPVVRYDYSSGDEVEVVTEAQVVAGSQGDAVTTSRYDVGGRLVWERSADGSITRYEYDLLDRQTVAKLYKVEGETETLVSTSTTTYNTLGWVLCIDSDTGSDESNTYDAAGRLLEATCDGKTTTSTYQDGRLLRTTSPEGDYQSLAYDLFGRQIRSEHHAADDGLLRATQTTFDPLGRQLSQLETLGAQPASYRQWLYADSEDDGTDETLLVAGTGTAIDRNPRERDEATTTASAAGCLTRTVTARDSADRISAASLQLEGHGNLSASRGFDAAGHLVSVDGSGYSNPGSYAYNGASNPGSGLKTSQSLPLSLGNAITRSYLYDINGRLDAVSEGGTTTDYDFDERGNLTKITAGGTVTDLVYETDNRLIERKVGGVSETLFGWDTTHGWRTSQGPPAQSNKITYTYNDAGRLTDYDERDGGAQITTAADYAYDAAGQRISSTVATGGQTTSTSYTYEDLRLHSLASTTGSARHNLLLYPSFELDSDADGRADGVRKWSGLAGTPSYSLVAGRSGSAAQQITYTGAAGESAAATTFQLDDEGTALSASDAFTFSTYLKGNNSDITVRLQLFFYDAGEQWLDDELGNPLTLTGGWQRASLSATAPANTAYVCCALRITDVDESEQLELIFDDALAEKSATAEEYFDGESPGASWDGASQASTSSVQPGWRIDYLYDEENVPYVGIYSESLIEPVVFAMITTDRGDVVELLDANGAACAAYRYDEWGKPTSPTSQSTNLVTAEMAANIAERQILRYAGYAYDAESGLYYCSARYYDPDNCQWTSKDPAKADGEESAYQYCTGNPVVGLDPLGLFNLTQWCREWLPGYAFLYDASHGHLNVESFVEGASMIAPGGAVASRFSRIAGKGMKSGLRVFYSGSEEAQRVANLYARRTNQITIDMTPVGKGLSGAQKVLKKTMGRRASWKVMRPLWVVASRRFARDAERATFFAAKRGISRRSIWYKEERRILRQRGLTIKTYRTTK